LNVWVVSTVIIASLAATLALHFQSFPPGRIADDH
jgi:hypothetical protein